MGPAAAEAFEPPAAKHARAAVLTVLPTNNHSTLELFRSDRYDLVHIDYSSRQRTHPIPSAPPLHAPLWRAARPPHLLRLLRFVTRVLLNRPLLSPGCGSEPLLAQAKRQQPAPLQLAAAPACGTDACTSESGTLRSGALSGRRFRGFGLCAATAWIASFACTRTKPRASSGSCLRASSTPPGEPPAAVLLPRHSCIAPLCRSFMPPALICHHSSRTRVVLRFQ